MFSKLMSLFKRKKPQAPLWQFGAKDGLAGQRSEFLKNPPDSLWQFCMNPLNPLWDGNIPIPTDCRNDDSSHHSTSSSSYDGSSDSSSSSDSGSCSSSSSSD